MMVLFSSFAIILKKKIFFMRKKFSFWNYLRRNVGLHIFLLLCLLERRSKIPKILQIFQLCIGVEKLQHRKFSQKRGASVLCLCWAAWPKKVNFLAYQTFSNICRNFCAASFYFLNIFQQDGPAILPEMEPPPKQLAEGVFQALGQWAVHRCTVGHWKQNYPVSQSGTISLFQLLWKSIFDFWWEEPDHHFKGYLLWWYLGLSRVHVPWRNQCRPGKCRPSLLLRLSINHLFCGCQKLF